jgi:tRNA-2-methylthio-N6-dimethylallyladenosine synthase
MVDFGSFKNYKKSKSNVFLTVVGCMSQQKHVLEKIKESYSYTDIVLGTNAMNLFPKKLYEAIVKKEKKYDEIVENNDVIEGIPFKIENNLKASVTIIYGCNNFCSYCIVPYVRGRERSRKAEDIINDIKYLCDKGCKEITLLGQNVNSYKYEDYDFSKLLEEIEKIKGVEVIKFMSPHPKDFTDDLIQVISKSKKIYKQIHLPLQSGSSRVLNLMNRKYTKENYLELVEKIKTKCVDVSFSTDIIVGFPFETENDFLETLEVVEKVKFDQIFMYLYSKRIGTKAALLKDTLTKEEKNNRFMRLKELSEKIIFENNEKMVGNEYELIVEGQSKENKDFLTGRTNNNKIIIFKADKTDIGKTIKIKITENHLWYLKGEFIKNI